ncbi:hypothetical protein QYE76_009396 [Lolium multiflorum]|uniref:DUF4218 domain-containing protein n=1 Tax=Lolium multiflorum TaxID=4521 RepID=A0AAD8TUX5_LOLMU|nr:hypothetical protein QYE76_009396 [Lolium multiflorum]
MAESTPVKHEGLADDLKRKHNKAKAALETELIGSYGKTRSHGIRLDGDTRPLPGDDTVDLSHSIREPGFSFDANMAGFVIRHDADKAESSRARGKEKDEAAPRDRPQDDDKRYLAEEEARSMRYPRPLTEHLLSKYDQPYDRRHRYGEGDHRDHRNEPITNNRQLPKMHTTKGKDEPSCSVRRLGPLPPQSKRTESSQEEDFEESGREEDRCRQPRRCPDGLSSAPGAAAAELGRGRDTVLIHVEDSTARSGRENPANSGGKGTPANEDFLQGRNRLLKKRRTKGGATTTRPTLVDPNLRAVTAFIIIPGVPIGAAADGLLVAAPEALCGGFILFFVIAVVVVPPLAGSSPSRRNRRSSSPSVRGSSSSDSLEKSQSRASQYSGAGLVDGHQIDLRSSSLEEEDWRDRPEEAVEEEESMGTNEGIGQVARLRPRSARDQEALRASLQGGASRSPSHSRLYRVGQSLPAGGFLTPTTGIVNQHLLRYSFMEGHTQWMSDDGDDDIDGDGDDDGGDDDNEGDGEDAPHDNGDEVEEDGAHVDGDQEGREEHAADEDMSRNTPLTAAVQDRHVQELLLSNTSTDPKIAGRRKAKLDQLEVDSRTPLYDAARGTEESRLRYALDIMEMKAKHKWTDTSVDELFGYLKIHFPKDNTCAGSLQEAKKIVCPLDLPHQKYHACISDCVIYRNEHANLDTCPQCGESQYKRGTKKSPRKVVWYFPLTPRLQRYFVDPKEAKLMRWHAERKEAVMRDVERVENPVLTHPSDASQWKTLDDEYYEEFGKEPRNIRLGASTDGLNPFGNQSSKHSTWPVFVWMYNLPPWLCLKKKYIHMSMLIQGPTQPGSDINLYLELLKEELVTLWEEGTETWDAYGQETFRMKAALLTTVQDYLGYGYIACQVCHGHKACVRCMEKTPFLQLGKDPGSSKTVYMRHRMWLPKNDPWRKRGDLFNGKDEVEGPPPRRSGEEIDTLLKNWKDCPPAGKIKIQKRKKGDKRKKKEPGPLLGVWKRRSVFWDLPYWKILGTPHSLDVMHITKNVCESLLGTVLNMPERTKDGSKARHDLMALDIRKELHFAQVDQETEEEETDGRKRKRVAKQRETPRPSCFTLNPDELEQFFKCLLEVKFPLGYAGLIRRWLDPTKKIFSGMKSHDCHVMMMQILPVAIRGIMEPHVRATLTDLCNVFDVITRKSITVKKLGRLQEEIVTILCEMEMYFPPAFFDIMVHLLVHIVDDIEDLGPAFLHNMMALERMNGFIKGYVRNRAHPDGSIVQGFLTEECISFCKNYLNEDDPRPVGLPANKHLGRFEGVGHNAGRRELDVDQDDRRTDFNRAHLVALQHMNEVEPWVDQHINMIKSRADKPMTEQENSGVTMESYMGEEKKRYYGRIEEIWELDYVGEKLPMFRVRWATDVTKEDAYVTTMRLPPKSKTKNPTAQNEPWVLAKHVEQCFFITDPSRPSRVVVRRGKRALVGMDGVADEQDFDGLVGDPMMEEPDEDDRTYTLRRRRTTLPRSSVPPYTRSRDDTGGITRTKRKGL